MSASTQACPRCEFPLPTAAEECARCGVVLAKLERDIDAATAEPLAHDLPTLLEPPSGASTVDASGRRAIMLGAALAAVTLLLPFTRFVVTYMIILVHELGHAVCGWLFGYPSVPAFDFTYGGGVTSIEHRRATLVVLILAGWVWLLWTLRRRPRALVATGVVVVVYAVVAATRIHEALITFMGHGSELVFAGIFFYRALSNYAVRVPAERPLYAFLGFFIVARDLGFAWGLMTSEQERQAYADAKGGGHWMDFSQLAHDFGAPLASVAGLFLVLTLATLPLTWAGFRYRHAIANGFRRLLTPARS